MSAQNLQSKTQSKVQNKIQNNVESKIEASQSQVFNDLSKFEGLLKTAKEAIHQKKYDQLDLIKTLAKNLLRQAFLSSNHEVFAKVIKLAVDFGYYAYQQGAQDILAQMFELYAIETPNIRNAFEHNNLGLFTWWLVQGHPYSLEIYQDNYHDMGNFEDFVYPIEFEKYNNNNANHAVSENKQEHEFDQEIERLESVLKPAIDPRTVLSFKNKVFNYLKQNNLILRPAIAVIQDVENTLKQDDLPKLRYYAAEASALLQNSFEQNDTETFSKVLGCALQQIMVAHDKRRWDYIIAVLGLEGNMLAAFESMVQNSEKNLLIWHLVNTVRLGQYARFMPINHAQSRLFKEKVYNNLRGKVNVGNGLRSPKEIIELAMKNSKENLCSIEARAIICDTYANLDTASFAEMLLALGELTRFACNEKKFEILPIYFDLDLEEIESIKATANRKHIGLFHWILMQSFKLEKLHTRYNLSLQETQKFKQEVYAIVCKKLGIKSILPNAQEFFDSSLQLIAKQKIEQEELSLHCDYAESLSQHAYQLGDVTAFCLHITAILQIANHAYQQGKIFELLSAFNYSLKARDAIFSALSIKDTQAAMVPIVAQELHEHERSFYGLIGYENKFRSKVCKELNIPAEQLAEFSHIRGDFVWKDFNLDKNNAEKDMMLSAEDPNTLAILDDLLVQVKASTRNKEFSGIDQIKHIALKLCHQSFLKNKPEILAKIIKLSIDFARYCHQIKQPEIAARVFNIFATDICLIRRALERQDYNLLAFWLVEDLNFEPYLYVYRGGENAERLPRTLQDIQPFKQAVFKLLQENNAKLALRNSVEILNDIQTAYLISDTLNQDYHVTEARAALKHAFFHNNVAAFSLFLKTALEMAKDAKKQGNALFLLKVFELEPNELPLFARMLENHNDAHLLWQFVDGLRLEREARHMPIKREECILFKKNVFATLLGKGFILRDPGTMERAIVVKMEKMQKSQSEGNFLLIEETEETKNLLIDCFLRQDEKLFSETLHMIVKVTHNLLKQGHISLLSQIFELKHEDLELSLTLLKSNKKEDQGLIFFMLIEYLELEQHSINYRIEMADIIAFKASVYKTLGLSLQSPADLHKRCMEALGKKIDRTELLILREHIQAVLTQSFQQGEAKRLAEMIKELAAILLSAYQKGHIFELLEVCHYTLPIRNKLFQHLAVADKTSVTETLLEEELKEQASGIYNWVSYFNTKLTEFKMKVYDCFGRVPPELEYGQLIGQPNDSSFGQLQEFSSHKKILDWLVNLKKPFDLSDATTQRYLGLLAKIPYIITLFSYLETFKQEPYPTILGILKDLSLKYRLAHHFGLGGKTKTNTVEIELEGSLIETWLTEISTSHYFFIQDYYDNNFKDIVSPIHSQMHSILPELKEADVKPLGQMIHQNVSKVSLHLSLETIQKQLEEGNVINIPLRLKTEMPNLDHYALITLAGNLCMISDNSRVVPSDSPLGLKNAPTTSKNAPERKQSEEVQFKSSPGIMIYEITNIFNQQEPNKELKNQKDNGSELNNQKNQNEIMDFLRNLLLSHQRRDLMLNHKTYEETIINKLGLVFKSHLLYRDQKVGNCGYASCAKMIVRATSIACCYQFLLQKGLKQFAKRENEAFEIAKRCAKIYGKMFAAFDRAQFLNEFFYAYKVPENKIESDAINVAKSSGEVKAKSENKNNIEKKNITEKKDITEKPYIFGLQHKPDLILLNQIYLKSQNRPIREPICKLLEQNGVVFNPNSAEAKAAYELLLEQVKEKFALNKEPQNEQKALKDKEQSSVDFKAKELLNHYLKNEKSSVKLGNQPGSQLDNPSVEKSVESGKSSVKPAEKPIVFHICKHQSATLDSLAIKFDKKPK